MKFPIINNGKYRNENLESIIKDQEIKLQQRI